MRKLSSIIGLLILTLQLWGQSSPHGKDMTNSCTDCHTTSGWKVDLSTMLFNHSATGFTLEGQHRTVACKDCHLKLLFAETHKECNDCHTDMHQQTVGLNCARCHNPNSWMVDNINQLHMMSRFPLVGVHADADCNQCHTNLVSTGGNASLLIFEPLSIDCYNCHRDTYLATTKPNHSEGGFSTTCTDCHKFNSFTWSGSGFNHNFFPLTGVHEEDNCSTCHKTNNYSEQSSDCISCHQPDFLASSNPNHVTLNFPTQCTQCHSLTPGWIPASYKEHDNVSFPIYSGEHANEWVKCTECHQNIDNYLQFTCIDCHDHNKGDMDDKHGGLSGYQYTSEACFACHPTGNEEGSFNHNTSAFPLTGAHTTTDCAECHSNGYVGTSTICLSCHTNNYNSAVNPNHQTLGISNDCALCHTTNPDWNPATFSTHNNYYKIEGAHALIANECVTCHNGTYSNLQRMCFDCHLQDYNQTSNPVHSTAQFPTTCDDCHSQNAWKPSTFNHDGNFPIYSGKHYGKWNLCSDCHKEPSNFSMFTCTTSCHPESETYKDHHGDENVTGYVYESSACYGCHPLGEGDKILQKRLYRKN